MPRLDDGPSMMAYSAAASRFARSLSVRCAALQFAFHLVRAVAVDQFTCRPSSGSTFACETIQVATPAGPATTTTTQFVYTSFGATNFADRWADMGIAALIWVGFLLAVFAVWRVINHQKR